MGKRLLFIIHTNSYGGAEKILFWLANELMKVQYEVTVLNLNESNNSSDFAREIPENIKMISIGSNKNGKLKHFDEIKFVYQQIKIVNPIAIISFTRLPNAIAGLCGWLTRTPSIISERSDPRISYNSKVISFIMRKAAELADMCVFQTEAAQSYASKKWAKKSVVIPNPIFLPQGYKKNEKTIRHKTVVSFGRFDNYQKRYDVLIKGFSIFHDKHPEYKLKLFGSGQDEELIKSMIKAHKIENDVIFMGVSKNPFVDIVEEGIFVLTSDFEGIPNSLLEAMAMGFPVVSTDCEPGGARMLITDHENGIIIPRNKPVALAQALCEYVENDDLTEECANNAKRVIHRFAPERIFSKWQLCLNKVKKKKL